MILKRINTFAHAAPQRLNTALTYPGPGSYSLAAYWIKAHSSFDLMYILFSFNLCVCVSMEWGPL